MKLAPMVLVPWVLACSAEDDGAPTPPHDAGIADVADASAPKVAEPKAGPSLETTVLPPAVPVPSRPVSFKVKRDRGSAMDTKTSCTEEGRGECVGAYVVWCSEGTMVAEDCSLFLSDDRTKGFCGGDPRW